MIAASAQQKLMAASTSFQSVLLVKDVPAKLPVNISGMEQGWLLYRCDRASEVETRSDPCMKVSMIKVQRLYDLAQHALGWQRQRIAGWRLAARVEDEQLVSVRDSAWRVSSFLVVEVPSQRPRCKACPRPRRPTLAPACLCCSG